MPDQSYNIETIIKLNKFSPRNYQLPILDAIENKGYKKVLAILPRRAGKDITAFNLCIRECLRKVCVIYYIFPTYSQGKKILWDSITNSGERILDYIPDELVSSKNGQEMKIRFNNGSLFQIVGSDNFDSLMGTNPQGVVFSEYALQDPRAYQYIRPILTANQGWALFITTPRGKNHAFELYQIALHSPEWFAYKLTIEDTQHIPLSEIEKERQEGIMSDDLIEQEYYTSFTMGVEGAYYAKYLDKMRLKGQIGTVSYEPGFRVNTAWDLGYSDSCCIIFYQIIGQTVRIIDYYEKNKEGLEHYAKVLANKDYVYGKHFAPHDIGVTEFGSGVSRLEKAKQLGIKFEFLSTKEGRKVSVLPNVSIADGIEAVRSMFAKTWIDERNCSLLIKCLENYRQEYDPKRKVYKENPLHNWASHGCFTGDTLVLTRNGMRQIMLIEKDTEVLTLQGWKKCSKAFKTQTNAQLVEVTFNDGTKVKCTPDHLFLTTPGWKSISSLQKSSKIRSSLIHSLNTLTENCFVYGLMKDIFRQAEKASIDRCGKQLLAQYLKTVTFITEIMKPLTTISGISNVFQKKSILDFLDQITKDLQIRLETKQQNGIDLTKADYGIKDMLKDLKVGKNGRKSEGNALIVNQSLRVLYAEMGMNKNSVIPIAKLLIIVKIEWLKEKYDVYDITVPDIGHFSLSNGAIVHNSDATRYLALSLPKTREGTSPEELDKRYREAVYGASHNIPSVFRNPDEY